VQITSRDIGERLVARGVLTHEQFEFALAREVTEGVPLSATLRGEALATERQFSAAVAEHLGLQHWSFDESPIASDVDRLVPESMATRLGAVAVAREGDTIVVAMADPTSETAVGELGSTLACPVRPVVVVHAELVRVLTEMYGQPMTSRTVVEETPAPAGPHVNQLLTEVVALGASDLHLTAGLPPSVRIDGAICPLQGHAPLSADEVRRMIYAILAQRQRERFENDLELDTSHSVPGVGRFRVNVFYQRNSLGSVMRVIPATVIPFEQLALPPTLYSFTTMPRGMVLLTGPTGSGKSTTLASMVDVINSTRDLHIMTVEDPIEFLHKHKRSIVNQREVGEDTKSFAGALKHVLRQDPDVILVGEMRDLETISTALTAAETGHLVFGTLHTLDAPQAVDRIIDVFPPHQQQQVRVQLAASLRGVVTQQLLPRAAGRGRVAACEILVVTAAVRNLIREGKTHQIYSAMQAGGAAGMQTMDQALAAVVRSGEVAMSVALERCANEEDLRRLVSGR